MKSALQPQKGLIDDGHQLLLTGGAFVVAFATRLQRRLTGNNNVRIVAVWWRWASRFRTGPGRR